MLVQQKVTDLVNLQGFEEAVPVAKGIMANNERKTESEPTTLGCYKTTIEEVEDEGGKSGSESGSGTEPNAEAELGAYIYCVAEMQSRHCAWNRKNAGQVDVDDLRLLQRAGDPIQRWPPPALIQVFQSGVQDAREPVS